MSPGQHSLTLQHPYALDDDQPLQVAADSGASVDVALWRGRPDVLPLRPVYPGASLVDARFLDDGQVVEALGPWGYRWAIDQLSPADLSPKALMWVLHRHLQ